jgi:hypothetical protein
MAGIIETIFSGPAFDKYNQIRGDSYVNSPTKFDYDLRSNEAAGQFIQDKTKELLGDNLGSKILGQAATYASVPLALYSSPFHEGLQVVKENRMKPESGIRGFYDAFMKERPFTTALNRAGGVLQSTPLGQNIYNFAGKLADLNLSKTLADSNLSKTLSNSIFTPAYGDIPTKEERQGIESFNNLVSDTVMAEPNQFQDYPGDKNLGSVQDQNLGFDYNFDENVLKEEEDAQYNLDNKGSFNMEGILQSLGGFAKDAGGRYIGSQALGGAGGMLFGPIGGLVGGIIGGLKGGNLFNSPYIGAGAYTMDQYGNMYTADQLNKMNARGGYYSEPARDSRRRDQSIRKMEERKAQGLSYGINRLDELKQQAAQEEAARQSAVDAYFGGSDAGADSGRFDGASSRSEYDSNPTGYSGPF